MRSWLSERALANGHGAIDRGDLGGARRFVRALGWLRSTGQYELEAAIALQEGDPARAVAILRGPADRFPEVWRLDSWLGQAYSDQGAYAAARERFERVYARAGAAGGAIYNLALVSAREGDHAGALTLLDRSAAESEPMGEDRRAATRGYSLLRLARYAEAKTALQDIESEEAAGYLALALALEGREDEAWAAVRGSFRREPGFEATCEATRALLGGTAARTYRVMLDGLIDPATHPLGERLGFLTTAWINADDEAEALAIARRIEPDLLDLRLDESEWIAVGEDARKGYVSRGRGHTLYRDVSDWDTRS